MPQWDFSESLVNVLQILLARAMNPIPKSKEAELSNLLESEKDHADDYSNKVFNVLRLRRELDKILNDVEVKRRHIENLEEECIEASRRLFDIQHTILERIEVLNFEPSGSIGRPRSQASVTRLFGAFL